MWKIYDTLSKYRLNDLSKLSPNLTEMSDTQLLALTEDILSITELNTVETETPPKGVNLCPIGGDLSLGNLQEISKQLLLYADRIVLEEPITGIARHTIEVTRLTPSREEFLQRLHPLIRQLLLIRRAVEQGIIVFVHDNLTAREKAFELQDKVVHPQLDRIRHKLSDSAVCYRQPNGMLSFTFGKGSNQFNVIGGSLFTQPQLTVHVIMPNMEKDTSLAFGNWQPPPGSQRVHGRLIESDTKSRDALSKAVNVVISRVILGMHVAQVNGSNYLTDDLIEWEIIKLLSRIEGEQRLLGTKEHVADAITIEIAKQLVFLNNVSVEDILGVRNKYPNEFAVFRSKLVDLSQKVQEIDDWNRLNIIAKRIVMKEISPVISEIRTILNNLTRQRLRDTVVVVGAASLSALAHLFFPQMQPWIGAVPITWAAKREVERHDQADKLREKPMYFLWQVMRRAKQ